MVGRSHDPRLLVSGERTLRSYPVSRGFRKRRRRRQRRVNTGRPTFGSLRGFILSVQLNFRIPNTRGLREGTKILTQSFVVPLKTCSKKIKRVWCYLYVTYDDHFTNRHSLSQGVRPNPVVTPRRNTIQVPLL